MRITSIELAGTSKTKLRDGSPGLPRAFAKVSRKAGDEFITVEVITPGGERTHHVQAEDADDQWSMAECLQETLDGHKGTNSDINDYYRELCRFAD